MDRWAGRVALVTGASSGIGRAIASRLAEHGLIVVACARRLELLEELKSAHAGEKGRIIPIKCDLRKEEVILSMFDRIKREVGGVDICVNNAGSGRFTSILEESTEHWREVLELNILGTCICTREAVKSMRERGVNDGFIVNIGSIVGQTYSCDSGLEFYASTKQAIASITNGLRSEIRAANSRIRIMEIGPGAVDTEILTYSLGKTLSREFFSNFEALTAEDIADSVVYGLSAPPRANVSTIIIEPVDSPNLEEVGRLSNDYSSK